MGRKKSTLSDEDRRIRRERFIILFEREGFSTQGDAGERFGYTQQAISSVINGTAPLNDDMIRAIVQALPEYNEYWLRGEVLGPMLAIPADDDTFFADPAIAAIMNFLGPDFSYWKTPGDKTLLEIRTQAGENAGSVSIEQAQELKRMIDDFRGLILFRIKGGK